jgi:hypothetical protein
VIRRQHPRCTHAIGSGHTVVQCRLSAPHVDHACWHPSGSRIEWDHSGMVLANTGRAFAYRPFKPGQRYQIVVDIRTWGDS